MRLVVTWGGEGQGRPASLLCGYLVDLRRAFRHPAAGIDFDLRGGGPRAALKSEPLPV